MESTTWLSNTSLKDLHTIRKSILDAVDMTEQENGFLARINKEIAVREEKCQEAVRGYNEALSK